MTNKRDIGRGKGGGRPTTVTPEAMSKLREAFMLDYSDAEACEHAEISVEAYYRRLKKDEKFRQEMHRCQRGLVKAAKRIVAKEILVKGNAIMAFQFLKSRQPERYGRRKDEDEMPVGLPPGSTIILPGSHPHPRIVHDEDDT